MRKFAPTKFSRYTVRQTYVIMPPYCANIILSDSMLPFILCILCLLNNASKVAQAFMSVVNNRAPGSEADEYCAGVYSIMQECNE